MAPICDLSLSKQETDKSEKQRLGWESVYLINLKRKRLMVVLWGIVARGQPKRKQEDKVEREKEVCPKEKIGDGRRGKCGCRGGWGADGGVGLVVELSTKEGRALDQSKPSWSSVNRNRFGSRRGQHPDSQTTITGSSPSCGCNLYRHSCEASALPHQWSCSKPVDTSVIQAISI